MLFVEGFQGALLLRFLSGVALAGVHMPGLKLLTEYFEPGRSGRASGIYASSYALGSAGSFIVAGAVDAALGWEATFLVGAAGPVCAALAVLTLPGRRRIPRRAQPPARCGRGRHVGGRSGRG